MPWTRTRRWLFGALIVGGMCATLAFVAMFLSAYSRPSMSASFGVPAPALLAALLVPCLAAELYLLKRLINWACWCSWHDMGRRANALAAARWLGATLCVALTGILLAVVVACAALGVPTVTAYINLYGEANAELLMFAVMLPMAVYAHAAALRVLAKCGRI